MPNNPFPAIDTQNMFQAIYTFPDQLEQAMQLGETIKLAHTYDHIHTIVCAGMGGSAMAADVACLLAANSLKIPVTVVRNYSLPFWVNKSTLVILCSYSGSTQETLSCFADAQEHGAIIAGICSGDKLLSLLTDNNYDKVVIPGGTQPRAALGYLMVPLLYLLHKAGFICNSFMPELHASIAQLKKSRETFCTAQEDNKAYSLAQQISPSLPLIYGSLDNTSIIATRWRAQFAENSKMISSAHALPELDHNEIVGWKNNQEILHKLGIIWLIDRAMHPQNIKRVAITKEVIGSLPAYQIEVQGVGESLTQRMLDLINLGDWVSYWLAILHKSDPTTIDNIVRLKEAMAKA